MENNNGRYYFLDNAKFFLIIMVIMGHCLSNIGEGVFCKKIDAFIYFFHMPLFIFISGYFTKISNRKKFWDSTIRLFETFIIFDVIHIFINIASGKIIIGETNFWDILYVPQWSLWYLLSLIIWRTMTYLVSKASKIPPPKKITSITIAILIGLCAGFVPINRELSFQRTFFFLPFFWLGYILGQRNFNFNILRKNPIVIAVPFLIVLLLCVFYFNLSFKTLLEGCFAYYKFNASLVISPIIRLSLYILCFMVSVCVLRCVPQMRIRWISKQGGSTLYYYVYHTLLIYVVVNFIHYFNLPTSFFATICYVATIVLIIWLMLKVSLFRTLPNIVTISWSKLKRK
jgi:fucose 4-O-acetylase-like acetyltransferase